MKRFLVATLLLIQVRRWRIKQGSVGEISNKSLLHLSGIIASLIGQGLDARQAASLGVCLHAAAADRAAARDGQRGLLAGDLMPHLRWLINRME